MEIFYIIYFLIILYSTAGIIVLKILSFIFQKKEKEKDIGYYYALLMASIISIIILALLNKSDLAFITMATVPILLYREYRNRKENKQKENELQAQQQQKKSEALVQQQKNSDIYFIIQANVIRLLMKHIKTIITKYNQAIYYDDYDEVKIDKANKEIEYFIENVINKNILIVDLPNHISRGDYDRFIHSDMHDDGFVKEIIEKYITSFLNVVDESSWNDVIYKISRDMAIQASLVLKKGSKTTQSFIMGRYYEAYVDTAAQAIENNELIPEECLDFILKLLIDSKKAISLKDWFLSRQESLQNLDEVITGREFEVFCQNKLQKLGWIVKLTKASGDFGGDLVAERNGTNIVIQCKYYSKPIGIKAVQEVLGAMSFYKTNKSAVLSNQVYTKSAKKMAESSNVLLLHIEDLELLA